MLMQVKLLRLIEERAFTRVGARPRSSRAHGSSARPIPTSKPQSRRAAPDGIFTIGSM